MHSERSGHMTDLGVDIFALLRLEQRDNGAGHYHPLHLRAVLGSAFQDPNGTLDSWLDELVRLNVSSRWGHGRGTMDNRVHILDGGIKGFRLEKVGYNDKGELARIDILIEGGLEETSFGFGSNGCTNGESLEEKVLNHSRADESRPT
jgi:hypothetical protein